MPSLAQLEEVLPFVMECTGAIERHGGDEPSARVQCARAIVVALGGRPWPAAHDEGVRSELVEAAMTKLEAELPPLPSQHEELDIGDLLLQEMSEQGAAGHAASSDEDDEDEDEDEGVAANEDGADGVNGVDDNGGGGGIGGGHLLPSQLIDELEIHDHDGVPPNATNPSASDGRGRAALSPSRAPRGPPTAFVLPLLDVKMAEQACETCVVRQPILFAAAAECTYLLLLALDADTLEQCLFGTFRIVDAFTDDGRGEVTFSLEAVGGAAARLRDINVAELRRSMEFMPAGTGGRQVRGKLGTVAFDTFLAAHVPSDDNHGRGMAGPSSRLIDRVVGGSGGGDAADVSQPRVVLDGASIASTASPQNGG